MNKKLVILGLVLILLLSSTVTAGVWDKLKGSGRGVKKLGGNFVDWVQEYYADSPEVVFFFANQEVVMSYE